jgi:hypothetical protein
MPNRSPANAEIEYAGTITGRTEKSKCGSVTVIPVGNTVRCDPTGEHRSLRPEQQLAHARMHTVGTHYNVGHGHCAVSITHFL